MIKSIKPLELIKSLESGKLIGSKGLTELNQVNKYLLHVQLFRLYFNSIPYWPEKSWPLVNSLAGDENLGRQKFEADENLKLAKIKNQL